ncbi:MAG: hypothetical protein ACE5KJ_00370 [Candidatus Zixiibacteriota bacterium]
METGELIWNGLAAFLVLSIYSFLYKDNPFYKFAEHLVVGVSAGYFAMILYYNAFLPKLINPLRAGKYWYIIPGILGILMWARFSKKWQWLSRATLAFVIGSGAGVAIPLYLQNYVLRQLSATMLPVGFSNWPQITNVLIIIMVFCALAYFYFSKEHKGAFGGAAQIGIWTLMIGFGAGFGMTVMGRVALLAERVVFLRDYFATLFSSLF